MSISFKIQLSRFFTRFGDQSWDFAVPLVLISIFPGQLQSVAGYYLISKIMQIFLNPVVLQWIDRFPRSLIYKLGIGSQTITVILIWILTSQAQKIFEINGSAGYWSVYLSLLFLGILGSLGSLLMEISVGYDLVADIIPKEQLAVFNSHFRRIDLFTEVIAPVFVGLVFFIPNTDSINVGFSIVAVINILTFIPEYLILASINNSETKLLSTEAKKNIHSNPIREFTVGVKEFKDSRFVVPMVAYGFLWISALSPHGVLLTSYLKDSSKLSEFQISIFRGLGAFFGMIPTFLFPLLKKNWGLVKTSKLFLGFQAVCILLGALFFSFNFLGSTHLFLLMLLFSRIGLYGFSIGEAEARQIFIPSHLRGRINSVGVSITNLATLILFALGTFLSSSNVFSYLVWISSISVLMGYFVLLKWK